MSTKREDYISWEDYFMGIALLAAQRSKDPVTQVGACIVNEENKIVGIGYNGFPKNCSDDEYPWGKDSDSDLEKKYFFVCHAELNAILNAYGSKKGCRIYVTLFPCHECAKSIIQSGIQEVIFMRYSKKDDQIAAANRMFASANITIRPYSIHRRSKPRFPGSSYYPIQSHLPLEIKEYQSSATTDEAVPRPRETKYRTIIKFKQNSYHKKKWQKNLKIF